MFYKLKYVLQGIINKGKMKEKKCHLLNRYPHSVRVSEKDLVSAKVSDTNSKNSGTSWIHPICTISEHKTFMKKKLEKLASFKIL